MVDNGASVTLKDKSGECPLHIAASKDYEMMQYMIEHCSAELSQRVELVIEAYEISALSKSCSDPYWYMQKATVLRTEHSIPKVTLEPLECYNFYEEWETVEDLEKYRDDAKQLKLQAILARERIRQTQGKNLMDLVQEDFIKGKMNYVLQNRNTFAEVNQVYGFPFLKGSFPIIQACFNRVKLLNIIMY